MNKQNWRIILTAIIIVIACIAFWDTFKLWTMSNEEKVALQDKDPGALLSLQQKAIRLGLDLQGGIHVVLQVKHDQVDEAAQDDAVDRAIQVIRNRIDGLGVAEPVIVKQGKDRILVDLPGYTDANRAEELIGQTALLQFKLLESYENANLLLSKVDSVVHLYEQARTAQAPITETIVEEAPVEEIAQDDGSNDVLATLMGEDATSDTIAGDDPFAFDESVNLAGDDRPLTTRLEPALYNNSTNSNWPSFAVNKADRELIDKWLNLPQVKALIPVDVQFSWSTRSEERRVGKEC